MRKECPYCGVLFEADDQWHTWNRHVGWCEKNPRIIKMIKFHSEQLKKKDGKDRHSIL